jgi:hypothetical protein
MMNHGFIWVSVLTLSVALAACGGKQSAVEGKLLNRYGDPVAGVKIRAAQLQPIKGYEQLEAVTSSDGSFRIRGLYPSSQYILMPWSDKWTCSTTAELDSAPQGETAVLPWPMVIDQVFSKSGSPITDLATGATRFMVSAEGVITDFRTGLEWVAGPDQDTNYAQAEHWVANCKVAGGGWRMPMCQELATLYQAGVGEQNIDAAFKTTGWYVWGEPRDSSSAWYFYFSFGNERWYSRYSSLSFRVFAVRSRSR